VSTFSRTPAGKVAKHLFHPHTTIVWVEGDDDLTAYTWLVRDLDCRVERAGGKPACLRLAQELMRDDLPYVVVVDGDYDILTRRRSPHRRVVWLQRYAIENYLLEVGSMERLCDSLEPPTDDECARRFAAVLEHVGSELADAIALDAAAVSEGLAETPLPQRIERLLNTGKACEVDAAAVAHCCRDASAELPVLALRKSRQLIKAWQKKRRIVDLLRGHLAFGVLRRCIFAEVEARGRRLHIDNRTLLALVGAEVWNAALPADHRSLRRRLRRAISDAQELRRAG